LSASKCPVCKKNSVTEINADHENFNYYKCLNCGQFQCSFEVSAKLNASETPQYTLSSYIRDYNEYIYKPTEENIIKITISDLQSIKPIQIDEKIERFLKYVAYKQRFDGDDINISDPANLATLFYCKNIDEFRFLTNQIQSLGYCDFNDVNLNVFSSACRLTYKGIKIIYKLNSNNLDSKQCFIAMSFSAEHTPIFDGGIRPAVENINNFKAYRVDRDRRHDDKIDNKIIAEIKNSRFMVADFTGNKHNVYYEVGYAMGFRIPIIFTCDKNFFDKAERENVESDKIKFDLRQYPFILYKDLNQLILELTETINVRII